ncbi:MAG: hypothetical protein GY787_22275 [Alteromonadales bacterium]|nr:hypothetical protein [Alteromonadales bacterium]MCP4987471.1 hypothetical protein [Colwellia sp.]
MVLNGKSFAFINEAVHINKETIDIFKSISSFDNVDINEILFAMNVFKINVDSTKALQVIRSVNNIYESQAIALVAVNNVRFKMYYEYFMPIYKRYVSYLNENVNKALLFESSVITSGFSNEMVSECMELKAKYIPALEKMLFKYDVIKITVDEKALVTSLLSYKARIGGRGLMFAVIKSGANYPFITDNLPTYISLSQFKRLRKMFNVNKAPESVSVRLGSSIYNDFILMENKQSLVDIYMSLHRTYKIRIDTLLIYINSVKDVGNTNVELSL